MTQEEKQLLLKDLCARLPYGVKCQWDTYYNGILTDVCKCKTKNNFVYWDCYFEECEDDVPIEIVKPYLRPMSSMTRDESYELEHIEERYDNHYDSIVAQIDWLNAHHFDYRGLIPMDLAVEAP